MIRSWGRRATSLLLDVCWQYTLEARKSIGEGRGYDVQLCYSKDPEAEIRKAKEIPEEIRRIADRSFTVNTTLA